MTLTEKNAYAILDNILEAITDTFTLSCDGDYSTAYTDEVRNAAIESTRICFEKICAILGVEEIETDSLPDIDGEVTICDDGFVAEITSDEDFEKMVEYLSR